MNLFELKMMRAALRQALSDRSEMLSQEEIDKILDTILLLTKLIDELERGV
ncbi:hypothetical protein SAMN04487996_102299 [Dyadobacter soli]|uniref:Uncharacterized protein n=1 Tax=Dyadobacter soli TaxID=659014 RepID=A0A1G6Y050_9BACT|nr:hypothetical protein SAMN04487996_102299 [Dyadobacter soli]